MTHPRRGNKILLIFPKTGQDVFGINVGLPLGVLSLATVLKQAGFEPIIVDERVSPDFSKDITQALDSSLLFAGISTKTGHQLRGGLNAARCIRDLQPELPIVWGGVHPTLVPESTITHPLVDVICCGEGEETVVELARSFRNGSSLGQVKGILYKENNSIKRTDTRPLMTALGQLPSLDYGLLNAQDYFTIGHILREPQLQVCTSRGCVHRCGYCYNLLFNGGRFRCMSAERTFEEIASVQKCFGVSSLFFYDDYFFADPHRVDTLLDLIEQRGLTMSFEVSCRVDFINRTEMAYLHRLRDNGFKELLLGIESGDDAILGLIHKGFTVEDVLHANRKMAEAGICAKYSFMAGFPGETDDQILATVNLMRRLLAENSLASVTPLGIYTPYPGTELYQRCLEAGLSNFPKSLEEWADYNWVEARHSFLSPKRILFLNRLNVMSRFFDRQAFERFGTRMMKPMVMCFYHLVRFMIGLRLWLKFFAFMPEIRLINALQKSYIDKLHRRLIQIRKPPSGKFHS